MNRKIVSIFSVIMLLLTLSTITAFSIAEPSQIIAITSSESSRETPSVYGTFKRYGGTNFASSKHNVSYTIYKSTNGSNWVKDSTCSLAIGVTIDPDKTTSRVDSGASWKLKIAPAGIFINGCNATGYIL